VIRPWLSQRTQGKIVFCKPDDLHKWIDEEALPTYWGGKDATAYSPKDLAQQFLEEHEQES
jgi:hypothetical protein